ncbi:hypothetical protein BJF95_03200 [Rhizobium oryziradicis]|uniref:Uncharacterized protein n=1 Tax=Rhizobium oryziradicis TaxID=1867956 RepID=A0A1Q8ZVS0_9HYPH|nr:hypothetical protein BJF95_03200 [Rhizobium oryziradicis]
MHDCGDIEISHGKTLAKHKLPVLKMPVLKMFVLKMLVQLAQWARKFTKSDVQFFRAFNAGLEKMENGRRIMRT